MNWLFFAILSVLGSAVSNILRRVIMKGDKSDALATVIIFQFMGFVMMLVFAYFHGFSLPPLTTYPIHFIAQAVLWGLSSLLLFKASKSLEASEVTIISTVSSVITIITAVIFLHEVFNISRLIGVILILASVIFVSFQTRKMRLNRGVLYALGSSFCSGIAITNDTFILQKTDVYSMLVIGWLTPSIFLAITSPKTVKKLGYFFHKKRFIKIFLLTFFYSLGGLAFYLAITTGGQASRVAPISQISIIATIIIAVIFLKERDHLVKKFIAAVFVMIGVLLLR